MLELVPVMPCWVPVAPTVGSLAGGRDAPEAGLTMVASSPTGGDGDREVGLTMVISSISDDGGGGGAGREAG